MAAFLADGIGQIFHAEIIDRPFIVRQGALRHEANLIDIVHVVAGRQNIFFEQVDGVLDAVKLLLRTARSRQNAAVNGGVAAEDGHFFENNNVRTSVLGFNRCGQAGKT